MNKIGRDFAICAFLGTALAGCTQPNEPEKCENHIQQISYNKQFIPSTIKPFSGSPAQTVTPNQNSQGPSISVKDVNTSLFGHEIDADDSANHENPANPDVENMPTNRHASPGQAAPYSRPQEKASEAIKKFLQLEGVDPEIKAILEKTKFSYGAEIDFEDNTLKTEWRLTNINCNALGDYLDNSQKGNQVINEYQDVIDLLLTKGVIDLDREQTQEIIRDIAEYEMNDPEFADIVSARFYLSCAEAQELFTPSMN